MDNDQNFKEVLKVLSKSGGYEILKALKNEKRWSLLEGLVKDKRTLSFRLKELKRLGIVEIKKVEDTPKGTTVYSLTPFGKKLLKVLENLEEEYDTIIQ
ncbi:transcriptional regulator [Archaeoglobales archaeon]|nr:MAG: transcriptional regulator [Archaeoglobales archaeon]